MAIGDVTTDAVLSVKAEFDRSGRRAVPKKYGDRPDRQIAAEVASTIGGLKRAFTDGKPMLKQAVALLWAIGCARAGKPRLLSWPETVAELKPLLETYRRDGEGRKGRPDYPIAALFHAGLWDLPGHSGDVPRAHGDAELRAWFADHSLRGGLPEPVYTLARRSGPARIELIEAVAARFFDDFDEADLLRAVGLYDEDIAADATASGGPAEEVPDGDRAAAYSRLCTLAARRAAGTYGRRRTCVSHDPIRLATARRAVLLRSEGRCENPRCARPAPDLNDHGRPLLEVDHVVGLADGGRDDPEQMIALCPNCHRVKTHGRTRHELIVALARTAKERHAQWMTGGDG
ncbi:hypothetical protein GCM10010151_64970 [Actinoallomurus spadix]|uniref:HNH nuclease domain-containing protein n=2 Tax=Actinoallomurus spadix TaxID=79912 RepID=A0ABN0XJT0_9ACTN